MFGLFECEHEWVEFDEQYAMRGNFKHESGQFEWKSTRKTGERCAHCSETRNVEKDTKTYIYEPTRVE